MLGSMRAGVGDPTETALAATWQLASVETFDPCKKKKKNPNGRNMREEKKKEEKENQQKCTYVSEQIHEGGKDRESERGRMRGRRRRCRCRRQVIAWHSRCSVAFDATGADSLEMMRVHVCEKLATRRRRSATGEKKCNDIKKPQVSLPQRA